MTVGFLPAVKHLKDMDVFARANCLVNIETTPMPIK